MVTKIEAIKKRAIPVLQKHEVKRAALFGSAVRGEMTKKSDIDFLVELKDGTTLLDLVGLQQDLEGALRRHVDVVTYMSLHHLLRDRILKEQKVIM